MGIDSRRITISAVARAAGVGTGTVSRVLNGSASVRASTRARVLEVIDRLDYRPSRLASGLSKGTPRTVAIVVPYLTRPSVVERLAGAIAVLDAAGYDPVVFNVETAEQRDRHLDSLTARHRADGVVVISLPLTRRDLAAFDRSGVPLAMVDVEAPGVPHTVVDDVLGGSLATRHLLALGHRRVAFLGDNGREGLGFRSSRRRLSGFHRALAAAGLGGEALVRRGDFGALAAAELAADLLGLNQPPTAIFAASDTQAIGVLAAADRLGIAVPAQLSVVGYDDIESAGLLGLTTVRQPLERSGALGAERLCSLLRGERVRPLRQELAVEVVPRASTARVAGRGLGGVGRVGTAPRAAPARTRPAPALDAAMLG